jgi:AhpD family alkylhydroperoxidase
MHEVVQTFISKIVDQTIGPRFDLAKAAPGGYNAMMGIEGYLQQCGIEEGLVELVKLRVSQMNGCAVCLEMHWKNLRARGECETRLYSLDGWRNCPYYSDRERAALEWAEAVTQITNGRVPDEVYQHSSDHFTEKELADLALAVATINAWNRLAISAMTVAGQYTPTQQSEDSDQNCVRSRRKLKSPAITASG